VCAREGCLIHDPPNPPQSPRARARAMRARNRPPPGPLALWNCPRPARDSPGPVRGQPVRGQPVRTVRHSEAVRAGGGRSMLGDRPGQPSGTPRTVRAGGGGRCSGTVRQSEDRCWTGNGCKWDGVGGSRIDWRRTKTYPPAQWEHIGGIVPNRLALRGRPARPRQQAGTTRTTPRTTIRQSEAESNCGKPQPELLPNFQLADSLIE
jgi:hypothetical protein